MGTNGQTIYVADSSTPMTNTGAVASGVNQVKLAPTKGAIFSLAATGGTPHVVAGTERTSPRGLDVIQENGTCDGNFKQLFVYQLPTVSNPPVVIQGTIEYDFSGLTVKRHVKRRTNSTAITGGRVNNRG